jgi:molybdopterin synthase sulfur carrier subunit
MSKIKFLFFSTLHDLTKTDSLELEVNGTVKSALEKLFETIGVELKKRIIDKETGNVKRYIIITINRKDIRHLNGFDTQLNDLDEITILPAVAGG